MDTEGSRPLRCVYTVAGNHTSTCTCNRNLMKFGYAESQKPTKDERKWVIAVAEAGFNIKYVVFHFNIHTKLLTEWTIVSWKKVGWRPTEIGQSEKKLTPLEEHFIQITSRRERFLTANTLFIMSRNCLWYVSIYQNRLEPSQMHV